MNEQLIRSYMYQAGARLFVGEDNRPLFDQEDSFKKFAELIVRECAGVAHSNADVDETYDYACHTIAWKIKEHFGVE